MRHYKKADVMVGEISDSTQAALCARYCDLAFQSSEDDDSGRFLRMIAPLLRILNEQIETIEVSNYDMLEMID
mgnify:CR=1 FL=1